jgi:hypothetical protein
MQVRRTNSSFLLAALGALLLAGCQSNVSTPAPPGLEPLDTCRAPWPEAVEGDAHPERIETIEGYMDDGGVFSHARGFLHASPGDVFKAMKDPEVLTDRRQIDKWSVTWNVEPEYQVSFKTHCVANRFITVEWDMLWRMGVTEGTEDAPEKIFEVARKVQGSSFVERAQHSFVVSKVEDNVTSLEIVVQGKGSTISPEDMTKSAQDQFDSLVARVHGRPLPTY